MLDYRHIHAMLKERDSTRQMNCSKETIVNVKNPPKVSVIVPAFNVQAYVGACIESLKAQTFGDYEAIVINDGSTDDTLSVIQRSVAGDSRFRVHSQENQGLSRTRNKGLSLARGEFIYFFDSDDLIDQEMLESTVRKAENENLDMVHFNAVPFNTEDYPLPRFAANNYLRSLPSRRDNFYRQLMDTKQYRSPVWLYLVRRELIEKNNLRFIEGIIHEDEAFTLQLINLSSRHGFIDIAFFKRRLRNNSIMTSVHSLKNVEGYFQTFCHLALWFGTNPDIEKESKEIVRKHIGIFYLNALRISIELGELARFRREAVKQFRQVVKHVPPKNSVAIFFPEIIAGKLAA